MNIVKPIFSLYIVLISGTIMFCSQQQTEQTAFSTDGTLAVVNKMDNTAMLINLRTGEVAATMPTGKNPHESAISPDGRTLVVSNYDSVTTPSFLTVIDITTGKVTNNIELGSNSTPHGIVFFPDGERVIVTTEQSRNLSIVNIVNGEVEQSISTGDNPCHYLAITQSGDMVFASSIYSGTFIAIDLNTGQVIKTIQTSDRNEGLDISPDGSEVWVGNSLANSISVIDASSLNVVAELELGTVSWPVRVKFTHDGRYVLVTNMTSSEVAVFDASTRQEVRRIPLTEEIIGDAAGRVFETIEGTAPIGILVHPNDQFAFIANTHADVVSVLDLNQWKIVDRLKTGREPDGISFSKLSLD